MKIFLIDDDIVARFDTQIRLHQGGIPCDISCFGDVREALVEFGEPGSGEGDLPDIVILDPDTRGFKGLEALEELKGLVGNDLYPDVYLLSAYGPGDRSGAGEHGLVRDILRKPISAKSVAGILPGAQRKGNG